MCLCTNAPHKYPIRNESKYYLLNGMAQLIELLKRLNKVYHYADQEK